MPMFQDIFQLFGIHWKMCRPTSGSAESRGANPGMLLGGLKLSAQHANMPHPKTFIQLQLQPLQPYLSPPSQPTSPATSHGPGVPRSTLPAEHRAPPAIRPGHASAHFASRAWNPANSGSYLPNGNWCIVSGFVSVSVD